MSTQRRSKTEPTELPRFLPSVTTHTRTSSRWRDKVAEISPLGLREVALFLTGVSQDERANVFEALERVRREHLFSIPFVHAVADMREEEYRYLMELFQTRRFNLHPVSQYPLQVSLSVFIRKHISIENASITRALSMDDLDGFNGICLDLSHLEDLRRSEPAEYEKMRALLSQVPVHANHLSAILHEQQVDSKGCLTYHSHVYSPAGDLSYIAAFPSSYFGNVCALELENSLSEQVALIPMIRNALAQVREPLAA